MNEPRDAFERLDTKLIILTWMVDLVVTPGVLRLLLHGSRRLEVLKQRGSAALIERCDILFPDLRTPFAR